MTGQPRTAVLVTVAAAGTAIVAACVLLLALRGRPVDVIYGLWIMLNGPAAVLSLWLGHLVLRRFPRHRAGRILLAMGMLSTLHVAVATAADVGLVSAGHVTALVGDHGLLPADLPLSAAVPLLAMNVVWVPVAVLAALLIAYFPDGELRGPGWRWVPVAAAVAAGLLMAATTIDAWPTVDWHEPADAPPVLGPLFAAGGVLTLAVVLGGLVSFVQRWRASGAERRRFEAVGGVLILIALLGVVTYPWPEVWQPLVHVGLAVFLGTYGAAVARYRLHDLEPVLGKGAVAVVLSVLAMLIGLAVVVGIGRLVGIRSGDPVLPLVVVAVTALLLEPGRRWARGSVERVLYGGRAEPTDVLARVADRERGVDLSATTDVAELLVRATGATGTEIELAVGDTEAPHVVAGAVGAAPVVARAPVRDRDRAVGEIRLRAHAVADLLPGAAQLLSDVAGLLSILVENDRLTTELTDELARSRTSRKRLVEAQEQARRELERDVHDGAQARLIAVRMHLGDLRRRVVRDETSDLPDRLDRVGAEIDAAIRNLRDLTRGLQPPVLEQLGLAAAVRAHLRDASLPVSVVEKGTARHSRAVEGAAYFACLEAIQNALRHSGGRSISVEVTSAPTQLRFCVADDGDGFEPTAVAGSGLVGIRDRVAALGGTIDVVSAPSAGTKVTAIIPVPERNGQDSSADR